MEVVKQYFNNNFLDGVMPENHIKTHLQERLRPTMAKQQKP